VFVLGLMVEKDGMASPLGIGRIVGLCRWQVVDLVRGDDVSHGLFVALHDLELMSERPEIVAAAFVVLSDPHPNCTETDVGEFDWLLE